MRSIPLAMTWEMLQRGRWILPGAFFAANAFPVLILTAMRHDGPIEPEDQSPLILMHLVMMQITLFVFGAAIYSSQGKPSRLYAFPVPTTTLVAWHLLPGMAVIILESLISTWLLNIVFHLGWPLWGPALFAAVSLAAINAVLWLTEKTAWLVTGMTLVAGILGVWYKSRYAPFSQPTHLWLELTTSEFITMLVAGILAYWGAVQAVARHRRGDTIPPLGIVAWIKRTFDVVPDVGDAFPAPDRAQFWFEWRQKGWVMPASVVFGMLIGVSCWLLFSRQPEELFLGFIAGGGLLSAAETVAGLIMGNTGPNDANFDMGNFLATRPITDSQMSRTILKTAGMSVLVAWAFWIVAFLMLSLLLLIAGIPFPEGIPPAQRWLYFAATLLGPWVVVTLGTSIGLTGRSALVAKIFCALFALFFGLAQFSHFMLSFEAQMVLFHTVVGIVEAACLAGTTWAFAAARRRALLERPAAYACAAVWCVLMTVVVADWLMHSHGQPHLHVFAATVATLSVAPLAAAPLALSSNRHR